MEILQVPNSTLGRRKVGCRSIQWQLEWNGGRSCQRGKNETEHSFVKSMITNNESITQDAHLALCGITVTEARMRVVDFSFPYWNEPSVVAIELHSNKWRYFIDSLSPMVWLAFLCIPSLLAPIFMVMEYFKGRMEGVPNKKCGVSILRKLVHKWYQIYSCLFNQGWTLCLLCRCTMYYKIIHDCLIGPFVLT